MPKLRTLAWSEKQEQSRWAQIGRWFCWVSQTPHRRRKALTCSRRPTWKKRVWCWTWSQISPRRTKETLLSSRVYREAQDPLKKSSTQLPLLSSKPRQLVWHKRGRTSKICFTLPTEMPTLSPTRRYTLWRRLLRTLPLQASRTSKTIRLPSRPISLQQRLNRRLLLKTSKATRVSLTKIPQNRCSRRAPSVRLNLSTMSLPLNLRHRCNTRSNTWQMEKNLPLPRTLNSYLL